MDKPAVKKVLNAERPPETADDREIARQRFDELPEVDKKAARGQKKKKGLSPLPSEDRSV